MSAKFRQTRAKELQMLNQILVNSTSCKNAQVLNEAAGQCYNNKPDGANSWGYSLEGLRFEVKKPQNTLPTDVGDLLVVEINLTVAGDCNENDNPDAFKQLVLDITISCETPEHKNICTWHFDRHIEGGEEPNEIHPLYHFQHGGNGMKDIAGSLGQVLLLTAPRIPFPPMDALLAVDFILSNFAGEDWQNLRDDGAYRNRISEAQKRYWKPYIETLLSFWEPGGGIRKDSISRFWPNLIHV